MFIRIRNRLNLLYSGLLMVFLIAFIVVTYFTFSYVIFHEHEEAVIHLANDVADKHYILGLPQSDDDDDDDDDDDKKYRPSRNKLELRDNVFYYILDRNGNLIEGEDYDSDLHKALLPLLKSWHPKSGEIRYENLEVDDDTEYLVVTGKTLVKDGKLVGTIYAGMDVDDQHEALDRLLKILIGLAIIFLLLSSIVGHFMAGKSMQPIMDAFARQRQFAADASHELRTPLSVLHASIEVIEAEEKNLTPLTAQIITDMKDETQRMGRLVGDLLTLARADSGRQQLSLERFDIYAVMAKLIRSLQPLAQKRNIELNLTGLTSLVVKADQERITQLLYILLDNAIKYTIDGGKVVLDLNESRKGNSRKVSISVSDTGIGITEDQLQHIFDRFYRVDPVRTRLDGGTGLGLSIAKWIVEAHHGTLTVESKLNVGSTFTVILPIIERSP